jgi:hypothetical protein
VADGDAVYDGEEATRAAPVAAAEDGSRQWFGVDLEQLPPERRRMPPPRKPLISDMIALADIQERAFQRLAASAAPAS